MFPLNLTMNFFYFLFAGFLFYFEITVLAIVEVF